ncbi:MAG: hypothetical protein P1U56_17940 [Saprospiraceae bacterium]|nr:hypothetical protein [Saprospiraceae bacterium]
MKIFISLLAMIGFGYLIITFLDNFFFSREKRRRNFKKHVADKLTKKIHDKNKTA